MFHCNGWCFPWSISVMAGTHVCLRQVRAKAMFDAIAEHGVTHLCGAPIVMQILLGAGGAPAAAAFVRFFTAAAPPPAAVLAADARRRFRGDASLRPDRDLRPRRRQRLAGDGAPWSAAAGGAEIAPGRALSRAGGARRDGPGDDGAGAADGETMGEVMFRGNVVMKGYLKDPKSTAAAFDGGWFHSGDLGVSTPTATCN